MGRSSKCPVPLPAQSRSTKVTNDGPDMIFTSGWIKTLETGCEVEVHFVDDTTAEVGLNNYVYTLKKL